MSNHSIVVQNLESFKNQILQGITYSESTPTSGQFTWDNTQRCVHVVTDNRGSFRIPLPKVNIGDIIKIQFECLQLSGSTVHYSVDYGNESFERYEKTTGLSYINPVGWNRINATFVSTSDSLYPSCVIGLSTGEAGSYKLRNIKIDIESSRNTDTIENNSYIIMHDNGLMEQYYRTTKTININGAWGQIFGSDSIALPDFKQVFSKDSVICNINVYSKNNSSLIMGNKTPPTRSNPGSICLFRGTAQDNLEVEIHVHAIGKWN